MDPSTNQTTQIRKRVRNYGIFGSIMTGIGGLMVLGLPSLIDTGLKGQMQLKEGNDMLKNWENTPLTITIKVYIWHIDNAREFANGAKAKLVEKGPYYYK